MSTTEKASSLFDSSLDEVGEVMPMFLPLRSGALLHLVNKLTMWLRPEQAGALAKLATTEWTSIRIRL
jgi:hypothetical protein